MRLGKPAVIALAALGAARPGRGDEPCRFRERSGVVSVEAENADSAGEWRPSDSEGGASGGFMTATSRRSKTDALRFRIWFGRMGRYRVWLRCQCTSDRDNDCYVMLDGRLGRLRTDDGWKEVSGVKTDHRTWGWDSQVKSEEHMPVSVRRRGNHVQVTTPGAHALEIGSRSRDFKVDKVVLLHEGLRDSSAGPQGEGPPETRSFPAFGGAEGRSPRLLAAEKAISAGRVGRGLRQLESLATSAGDPDEKRRAEEVLAGVKSWIEEERRGIQEDRGAGRVCAAYMAADVLRAALAGHRLRTEIRKLADGIRSDAGFRTGIRFLQIQRALEKADRKARNAALARFAEAHPGTYYGRLAREIIER